MSALVPLAVHRGSQLLWQVLRDAWRALRSPPAATAAIVGILTLGISAATVTFVSSVAAR